MSWRDEYRQASFRNVEFFVSRVDNTGGRRVVTHEFPKQDIPFSEDMGRQARKFTVEAYVLGDDYFSSRNRLLEAVEKEGPGKLIHPYLGTLNVACTGYRLSESDSENRIARFTLDFVESGENIFPSALLNTTKTVQQKKNILYSETEIFFTNSYSTSSASLTKKKRATATINKALSVIEASKNLVGANADYQRKLELSKAKAVELTYAPDLLFSELKDLLTFGTDQDDDRFRALAENARLQVIELLGLLGFAPDSGLQVASDPSTQISYMVQEVTIGAVGGLISLIEFESVQDAEKFQTLILEQIDRISQQSLPDSLYIALMDLRTAVVRDIAKRATVLPQVIEYTPNVSIPSIVLAWALYGTLDNEQDIIDRNSVQNPAFIPGSKPIQLLSFYATE